MRCTRSLARLERSCVKRVRRLQGHVDELKTFRTAVRTATERRLAEHAAGAMVIDVLNTWANFSRAYFVSCMLGTCTVSGTRVTPRAAAGRANDAIGAAVTWVRPCAKPKFDGSWNRRDEPTWHDPRTLIDLAIHCGFSHWSDVASAFSGAQSRTFQDLPTVRNFFAHRNAETRDAAIRVGTRYGVGTVDRPSELLFAYPLGRTVPLILDWLIDVELVIKYLCH